MHSLGEALPDLWPNAGCSGKDGQVGDGPRPAGGEWVRLGSALPKNRDKGQKAFQTLAGLYHLRCCRSPSMPVGSECVGHHAPNKKQVKYQLPSLASVCVCRGRSWGARGRKSSAPRGHRWIRSTACLLPANACPSFLPSALPFLHSWTSHTGAEWLSPL